VAGLDDKKPSVPAEQATGKQREETSDYHHERGHPANTLGHRGAKLKAATGKTELNFNLYNNKVRKVAWNPATGQPEDSLFEAESARIPPQTQY
jgi:hypothetical protein